LYVCSSYFKCASCYLEFKTQFWLCTSEIQNPSGYVHSEYKIQWIMISIMHFSTTDIGIRELQLQMLITYGCLLYAESNCPIFNLYISHFLGPTLYQNLHHNPDYLRSYYYYNSYNQKFFSTVRSHPCFLSFICSSIGSSIEVVCF